MLIALLLAACEVTPVPSAPVLPAEVVAPAHKFTFINRCEQEIWVGSYGQNGTPAINGGGWLMPARVKGSEPTPMVFEVGAGNSGRIWPRTSCTFPGDGRDHCESGGCLDDAGVFGLKCAKPGVPPAQLVEWTLDAHSGWGPIDTYDGSMVDGFNVPVMMVAVAGTYNVNADPGMDQTHWCEPGGCAVTPVCPPEYVDGSGCWSPCKAATRADQPVEPASAENLCCSCSLSDAANKCPDAECAGHYGCSPYDYPPNPPDMVCDPTGLANGGRPWDATAQSYVTNVHAACPDIYAWEFDDALGTFHCRKDSGLVDYVIEFCPGIPADEPRQ